MRARADTHTDTHSPLPPPSKGRARTAHTRQSRRTHPPHVHVPGRIVAESENIQTKYASCNTLFADPVFESEDFKALVTAIRAAEDAEISQQHIPRKDREATRIARATAVEMLSPLSRSTAKHVVSPLAHRIAVSQTETANEQLVVQNNMLQHQLDAMHMAFQQQQQQTTNMFQSEPAPAL
jgi:hypothetical protein